MSIMRLLPLSLLLACSVVHASEWWPPSLDLRGGGSLSLGGNLAWDSVNFSGADAFSDHRGLRRSEIGLDWESGGRWEAALGYDFKAESWSDVYLRLKLGPHEGADWGRLKIGYMRVPLGMEISGSSRLLPLMETSLPTQALMLGRRLGLEWELARAQWYMRVAGFGDEDLDGNNPATIGAARVLWTPRTETGDALHLGLSGAIEHPRGSTAANGESVPARLRMRARPGTGLGSRRLIDSGTLSGMDSVQRLAAELAWIKGPFWLQAEAMQLRASHDDGRTAEGEGHYAMAGWIVSGESRGWRDGHIRNFKPEGRWGGLEFVLRHDRLRLHGSVEEQRAETWTLGANWYLSQQFRLQFNHVDARNRSTGVAPDVTELRAHWYF